MHIRFSKPHEIKTEIFFRSLSINLAILELPAISISMCPLLHYSGLMHLRCDFRLPFSVRLLFLFSTTFSMNFLRKNLLHFWERFFLPFYPGTSIFPALALRR